MGSIASNDIQSFFKWLTFNRISLDLHIHVCSVAGMSGHLVSSYGYKSHYRYIPVPKISQLFLKFSLSLMHFVNLEKLKCINTNAPIAITKQIEKRNTLTFQNKHVMKTL